MKPRIVLAALFHETHTFLPEVTSWADMDVARGDEILRKEGDASPTDGFLEVARQCGWEILPTISAMGMAGGTVADSVFEQFWSEFAVRAAPALRAGDGHAIPRRCGRGVPGASALAARGGERADLRCARSACQRQLAHVRAGKRAGHLSQEPAYRRQTRCRARSPAARARPAQWPQSTHALVPHSDSVESAGHGHAVRSDAVADSTG